MQQQLKYTEEQLIQLISARNTEAFSYLYDSYSAALYGTIIKITGDEENAADVLQDVFIKIWQNFNSYDSSYGKLYTWMLNIARNTALEIKRSKAATNRSEISNNENKVNEVDNLTSEPNIKDNLGVRELLQKLKPEHSRLIDMVFFKGYSHEAISRDMNMPPGTVKTKIRSSINQLRELFK